MCGGGEVLKRQEGDPHLPPGYRLDRSDPDLWTLRRPEGWEVAYFSATAAIIIVEPPHGSRNA